MNTLKSLQDLKNIQFESDEKTVNPKSEYKNYSKRFALIFGYLLGVSEDFLRQHDSNNEFDELKKLFSKNENVRAIRCLNNIRSNIILGFKHISSTIQITSKNYEPIYQNKYLKDDFNTLLNLNINIFPTNRQDINAYIKNVNDEINRRINNIKPIIPQWINFKYIVKMFRMPDDDIAAEGIKYQKNQDCYPYKRYLNWEYPEKIGNILCCDQVLLDFIYKENGDHFTDTNKVCDVSDNVKYSINEFIKNSIKVQIFVDGENIDPYRFATMIEGLKDFEIDKIDKIIVYYDEKFSPEAWKMLKHFTRSITVEAIPVSRIKEDKSLVDHKIVMGVSKAYYSDNIDSVILASSDSDFWSIIEDIDINYLILIESDKCGHDFKEKLREKNIFYCYLDRFMTQENDVFFKTVFRKELKKAIDESFKIDNAYTMCDTAITQSRIQISNVERKNLYNKYLAGLKLSIDEKGNFQIVIPE